MTNQPSIDQWNRPRRCVSCGAEFSFASHDSDEARYAARHLQDGTLDAASLPPVVSKCPNCLAGRAPAAASAGTSTDVLSSAKEQQAVAAAMAIGMQMDRARYDDVYYYAKRVGMFVGLLSIGGIALAFGYGKLGQEGFSPVPWIIGLTIVGAAGFGASFWAHQQTRGD